jgi:hypothetical protein
MKVFEYLKNSLEGGFLIIDFEDIDDFAVYAG